jgi:DNA gyrase subunit A
MPTASQRDRVLPRLIEDEMRDAFIDYSMSGVGQRALPDVRDGLKPVHRRILYAMQESGLVPSRPYKKSATVVGDVLGRYHPHGDSAVYDAMVRMVQDFSLRYPLVDGQGNFGSIDGDNAAAYRYTEARLAPIATEMLADIDKETVDYSPNFDDRLMEPTVLPARLPNLLVNGSSGIAVGMSTNIPPHNLREVVRAAVHLLDHPDCGVDELMRHLPGPDFPTGALIIGRQGIRDAYTTGRGRVVMRARAALEQRRGGKEQLVVTEIPFQVSKSRVIEQIVDLSKKGKLPEVADLRDESDREGIRLVIELKRGAEAEKVLAALFRWTGLQTTFGVIALALDHGVPREFDLKGMLERYRDHRLEVVVRRSRWQLEKDRDEAHVIVGLLIALERIEEVVRLIRASDDREEAAEGLRREFGLTERQADAILDMRLVRLTALQRAELERRAGELRASIAELEGILASPERRTAIVRAELVDLSERYADARRTQIVEEGEGLSLEESQAEEEVVVAVSRRGYIKRIPAPAYRRRVRAGRPVAEMDRFEDDYLEHLFVATTREVLLFLSEEGRLYGLPVAEVPEVGPSSRGKPLHGLLGIGGEEHVAALLAVSDFEAERFLVFATAQGQVKRTSLEQFAKPRAAGIAAIGLREGDRLIEVSVSDGAADIVLCTASGRAVRFREADIAPTGRTAQGVRGIRLQGGDEAVGMALVRRGSEISSVTRDGLVKRTSAEALPLRGRGGTGIALCALARGDALVAAREFRPGDTLMVLTSSGRLLPLTAAEIPLQGRTSRGRAVVRLEEGEGVIEVTRGAGQDSGGGPRGGGAEAEDDAAEPGVGAGEEGEPEGAEEGAGEGVEPQAPEVAAAPSEGESEAPPGPQAGGAQFDLL